jgi:hypothetical protein
MVNGLQMKKNWKLKGWGGFIFSSRFGLFPPVVDPGPNQTNRLPAAPTLLGTVSDDGLPVGSALSINWSKVSGPGTVTFGSATQSASTASFSASGTYVLQLQASDSQYTVNSNVTVTVLAANLAPVVQAGTNQTVNLSAKVPLTNAMAAGASQGRIKGSKGKEFWLTFPENESYAIVGDYAFFTVLTLFISGDTNSLVSVSIPGMNFYKDVSIVPGQAASVDIPWDAQLMDSGAITNLGIHISRLLKNV